jgi:hypothetical protein
MEGVNETCNEDDPVQYVINIKEISGWFEGRIHDHLDDLVNDLDKSEHDTQIPEYIMLW